MENPSDNVKDIQALRARRLGPAKTISGLVCLNFKVPLQIRRQFKISAAHHNMTMTELLLRLLNDFMRSQAGNNQPHELQVRQEIKK
jgi:hypothetical protein